jgi:hypothetical protein
MCAIFFGASRIHSSSGLDTGIMTGMAGHAVPLAAAVDCGRLCELRRGPAGRSASTRRQLGARASWTHFGSKLDRGMAGRNATTAVYGRRLHAKASLPRDLALISQSQDWTRGNCFFSAPSAEICFQSQDWTRGNCFFSAPSAEIISQSQDWIRRNCVFLRAVCRDYFYFSVLRARTGSAETAFSPRRLQKLFRQSQDWIRGNCFFSPAT